jgi:phosphoribosylamine--glycine ligase
VDQLESEKDLAGLQIVGPGKAAARLEGSKSYAKAFMKKHRIPTAEYRSFKQSELEQALSYILERSGPYVLKADGLAAGKGVVILNDQAEALEECRAILGGKFGSAGQTLIIESFLKGLEFSVFALCDGKDYVLLPVAKDYKRIGEGDEGLNTGGMGAVSPVPGITPFIIEKVKSQIIEPTFDGLKQEGILYNGFLFFGLILVDEEPFVIEYNCRLGDPETQVILPRIQGDLVHLLSDCAKQKLGQRQVDFSNKSAICTVLCSGGYPEKYEKGKEISIPKNFSDFHIFHAGTKWQDDKLLTNGGRVLATVGMHDNLSQAKTFSQKGAREIHFEGKYYRSDIGSDLGA